MKKSVLFRTALIMLVLTMVSSCFVGGTFAKYVTSGEGTDSARVAKFGVVVTANGETFATSYDSVNDGNDKHYDGVTTVVSSDNTKVVAPGTVGNMVSMTLAGKPEVDVAVTYTADFEIGSDWVVNDTFYCPLVIKVAGGEPIKGLDYTKADDFEEAVEAAIAGYSAAYDAGTNLAEKTADSLSVSWEWPFATTGNDEKDTALGNMAADTTDGKDPAVVLTVTTTVTQID